MKSAADFGAWEEHACSPALGGAARNPGGTWRRVRHRLTTRFLRPSKSVDEETVMAARVHKHDLEVRNLRWRMVDFPELTVAHGGAWLIGFLGFPRRRPTSASVGSVSTGKGLMCTDLKS